jgi:hypothetical protein
MLQLGSCHRRIIFLEFLIGQNPWMNRTEPESYQDFDALPARMAGVVRSPRALFGHLIVRPRWSAVMLLTFIVTAACTVGLMETAVGRQALVDKWERTALAFGREVSDEQYGTFVAMGEYGAAYALMTALASGPVLTLVLSGSIYGIFGRRPVTYRQVLAVVAHAGVILMLRQLVATPFNYSRETLAAPTTLGQVLPMFDEASPPARFLGAVDLFVVWWVIVLAIGVALLYGRSERAIVATFMGAYVGFAALLAIAMVVTGGTV